MPAAPAARAASSIASRVSAYGVPTLTSTPPATPANAPASPGTSTIAGAAPTASSTLAVNGATTMLVRHCTSGPCARTASHVCTICCTSMGRTVPGRDDVRRSRGVAGMTTTEAAPASLATAMFSVADQDAAVAFYIGPLGWEVRADTAFGPEGERWLEVARRLGRPPRPQPADGRHARRRPDRRGGRRRQAEHARLTALGDVDLDPEPYTVPGGPVFAVRDADGNSPSRRRDPRGRPALDPAGCSRQDLPLRGAGVRGPVRAPRP